MKNLLQRVLDNTRQFLLWWIGELGASAADLRAYIAPKWRPIVTVFADNGRLIISKNGPLTQKTLVQISPENLAIDSPNAVPNEAASGIEAGRRVRLVIAEDRAFLRQLRFPTALLPHLKSAISLQFNKLLPVDPARLLIDFEVVHINPADGHFDVELAALKREDIDITAKAIRDLGMRVVSVRLAKTPQAPLRFNFSGGGASTRVVLRRMDRILLGSAAALGLACAGLAATQSFRADRALSRIETQTESAAGEALGRRQTVLTRLHPLDALSQLASGTTAIDILGNVSAIVPRNTWLTTFEVKDQQLRIVGLSTDSAAVVRFLTSSPLLADVELRSSMSAGIGTGKDRFEIFAKIKALPQ